MKQTEQEQEREQQKATIDDFQEQANAEIVGMYQALKKVLTHAKRAEELWREAYRAGRREAPFSLEITVYNADLGSIQRFARKFLENVERNRRLQALLEGVKNGK